MFDLLREIFSWIFLLAGGGVILIGASGIIRLPDFFTRIHASGTVESLGSWLVILGLLAQAPDFLVAGKLLLILLCLLITAPTASYALCQAAFRHGDGVGANKTAAKPEKRSPKRPANKKQKSQNS